MPRNTPRSDEASRIGATMRTLREDQGLSQRQVARRMGLVGSAQTLIKRYERGYQIPGADQLSRFLEAIGSTFTAFDLRFRPPSREGSRRMMRLLDDLGRLKPRS